MSLRQIFARKSLQTLQAEAESEGRLHRVLGPVSLTSLGVGAIIGAGIFAITGRVAAQDAGPAVVISFAVAGLGCALAALCYAEFAAMVPVAGSAYTYSYATLGELIAWIIGWDLVLEYAMSCTVVAAHWSGYLQEFLRSTSRLVIPPRLMSDPFTPILVDGEHVYGYCNLPAMLILLVVTAILVRGIKHSALTNNILVIVKVAVVLFVIFLGWGYVNRSNWTGVPISERNSTDLEDYLVRHPEVEKLCSQLMLTEVDNGKMLLAKCPKFANSLTPGERETVAEIDNVQDYLASNPQIKERCHAELATRATSGAELLAECPELAKKLPPAEVLHIKKLRSEFSRWGMLSALGIKKGLEPLDERVRSPFIPYGVSGIMVGAALVFFAFIGFDSISTHAEEAKRPQRDVPIGILTSLGVCTVLYILVSGVLTGMEPYPTIDPDAAVASAFRRTGEAEKSQWLQAASGLIATGALAGMTSVLLVTFLSQSRVFLAMARDRLLPQSIFAAVHPRYRTPHRSTILTGLLMCIIAGITPIRMLEEMVNIGTLLAFVIVCASVLILRLRYPDARRPFRCPTLFLIAPAGVLMNLVLMLFLPLDTWLRLFGWLALGLVIYFGYGFWRSTLRTPT